jgi:hypothetical protein
MLTPNQYTLTEKSINYGLHQFEKNGKLTLCQQHSSGDWITTRPATEYEIAYFTKHGKRA